MSFRQALTYLFIFFAAVLVPAVIVALLIPEGRERTFAILNELSHEKTIQISGLSLLTESDINSVLPNERSVFWWWLNQPEIESSISKSPLIKTTRLGRCEWWSWACFQIDIEERTPTLVAYVGERAWIVDADGAFIAPVPASRAQLGKFPIVHGVHVEGASNDLVKSRVAAVSHAAEIIGKETGKTILAMELRDNNEIEVEFVGLKAKVIFGLEESGDQRLSREASRFKAVLSAYSGKEQEIESIDLAFDKLAVVKTFEVPKS